MPEDGNDEAGTPRELDLRGLRCPLPALRTEKALRECTAGTRLLVLADDPLAVLDIPHLCRTKGHRLLAVEERGGHRGFLVQRGDDAAS